MTKSKEELIRILKSNIKEFNLYREETELKPLDLQDADLTGCNLCRVNFENVDLRRADLNYAYLHSANMKNCNLSEIEVGRADLSEANLTGSDLTNTNFANAILLGTNMSKVKGRTIKLEKAKIRETNFTEADLSEGNLSSLELTNVNFNRTILKGVNFTNSNLKSVQNLDKAVFDLTTIWPDKNLPKGFDPSMLNQDVPVDKEALSQQEETEINNVVPDLYEYEFIDQTYSPSEEEAAEIEEEEEAFEPIEFAEIETETISELELTEELLPSLEEFETIESLKEAQPEPQIQKEAPPAKKEFKQAVPTPIQVEKELQAQPVQPTIQDNAVMEMLQSIFNKLENLENEQKSQREAIEALKEEKQQAKIEVQPEESLSVNTEYLSRIESKVDIIAQTDPLEQIDTLLNDIAYSMQSEQEEIKNKIDTLQQMLESANTSLESSKELPDTDNITTEIYKMLENLEANIREDQQKADQKLEDVATILENLAIYFENGQDSSIPLLTTGDKKPSLTTQITSISGMIQNINDSIEKLQTKSAPDTELYEAFYNFEYKLQAELEKNHEKIENLTSLFTEFSSKIEDLKTQQPILESNIDFNEVVNALKDKISDQIQETDDRSSIFKNSLDSGLIRLEKSFSELRSSLEQEASNINKKLDSVISYINTPSDSYSNGEEEEYITQLIEKLQGLQEFNLEDLAKQIPTKEITEKLYSLDTKNNEIIYKVELLLNNLHNLKQNNKDAELSGKMDVIINSLITAKDSSQNEVINQKIELIINELHNQNAQKHSHHEVLKAHLDLLLSELKTIKDIRHDSISQDKTNIDTSVLRQLELTNQKTESILDYLNKLTVSTEINSLKDLTLGLKDLTHNQNTDIINKLEELKGQSSNVHFNQKLEIIIKSLSSFRNLSIELEKSNKHLALESQKSCEELVKINDCLINLNNKLQQPDTALHEEVEKINSCLIDLSNKLPQPDTGLHEEIGKINSCLIDLSNKLPQPDTGLHEEIGKINACLIDLSNKLPQPDIGLHEEIGKINSCLIDLSNKLPQPDTGLHEEISKISSCLIDLSNKPQQFDIRLHEEIAKINTCLSDLSYKLQQPDTRLAGLHEEIGKINSCLIDLNYKLKQPDTGLYEEIAKINTAINILNKKLSKPDSKLDDEMRSIIEHLLLQLNENNKTSKETTLGLSQKFEDMEMDLQITLKDLDRRISKINSMIRNIYKALDNLTDLVTESIPTPAYAEEFEMPEEITA